MKTLILSAAGLLISTAALAQGQTGGQISRSDFAPGVIDVGARLGTANVERVDDLAMQYGAFAEYASTETLLFGGSVDYWSNSEGVAETGIVETNDLSFSAYGKMMFNRAGVWRPFALAGVALHRFSTSVKEGTGTRTEVEQAGTTEDNDVRGEFGADLGAGLVVRVQQNFDLIGEVRARPLFDTAVERDQMAFTGGLAYRLGGVTVASE